MFELASLLLLLQNMLLEVEEKVLVLSELFLHGDALLMDGCRAEAQRLGRRLHALKSGLLELQTMLQDKRSGLQVRCFQPQVQVWT